MLPRFTSSVAPLISAFALRLEREGTSGTAVEYAGIDVADVEPGRYVLTVRVTDEAADTSVERSVPVELVE